MSRVGARLEPAFASLRLSVEDAGIRRLLAAWLVGHAGRWAVTVVTVVIAYDLGGAAAVAALGAAQFIPQMILAPTTGMPLGRWAPEAVLRGMFWIRIVATACLALAVFAGLPFVILLAAVAVEAGASVFHRPLHLAMLPAIARTPGQLVGANVASSMAESIGTFLGPAVAGLMLIVAGPSIALLVIVAVYVIGLAVVSRLRVPAVGRSAETVGARAVTERLLEGVRLIASTPGPRLVFIGVVAQTIVRGILNVLLVIAAIELLDLGEGGVGTLTAAIGLGGLVGAGVATLLAGGGRLSDSFAASLIGWGLPIVVLGLATDPLVAILAMFVVGTSNAVFDVTVDTLIQRLVPHDRQVAVLGLMELVINGSIVIGSLLAPFLIDTVGLTAAFIAAGTLLPLIAVALWPFLHRVDESGLADMARVDRIRADPLLSPLSLASVEFLASSLTPVRFETGAWLMRQGDHGDEYLLIDHGRAEVRIGDRVVRELGAGDGCGEIALVDDVPRTASVVALEPVSGYRLHRTAFLEAVIGHEASNAIARRHVAERHTADAERLAVH